MDLHAGQVQGFFDVPVDHMTAMPMLTQCFADLGLEEEPVIPPTPAGSSRRATSPARSAPTGR